MASSLLCPLNPSQCRSVQGLAPQHHESGSYLRQVLGLSGCDCGAGLTVPKLLPGCAMTCIQARRLQGCRAQREIIEFMDICKTAGETSSGPGASLMSDSNLCGEQHLRPPTLPPGSESSVRGWHPGRGLCWLPVLAVLPTTPPLQGKRCSGVPGSPCSGSGRHGNVHGAMTTQSTGTESKLCSAASVQNPPHPALL